MENTLLMDDYEQLSFGYNGNIAPCPYRKKCKTFMIGCKGQSYWCRMFDNDKKESEQDGDGMSI